jgi:antitoxin component YwqK of YwqJK toxin-antitoxin module
MKVFTCISLLLVVKLAFTQETVRKVKHSANGQKEVYHVLASDENILHGKYERRTNASKVEGYYKNGEQDSLWTEFSYQNKFLRVHGYFKDGFKDGPWTVYLSRNKLRFRGRYSEDKRTGKWKFYNKNGELEEEGDYNNGARTGIWSFYNEDGDTEQEYNFSTKELVSDISIAGLKETKFKIINGIDTTLSTLERPPLYLGGPSKMRYTSYKMIQLPKKTVSIDVRFVITNTGATRDYSVVNPTNTRLDNEAINKVTQLSRNWLPAMHNGTPVMVEYTLTVSFKRVDKSVYTTPSFMRSNAISNYVDPNLYSSRGQIYRSYTTVPMSTRIEYTTCEIQIR